MKFYNSHHIAKAEVMQLVLLASIYGQKGSDGIYFQGGTALRWCYGGSRFSEDLDFETHFPASEILRLAASIASRAEKMLVAHFGPGTLDLGTEKCDEPLCRIWFRFSIPGRRGKIPVKVDFQQLAGHLTPDSKPVIMGSLPQVAAMIRAGTLAIPQANAVWRVESLAEIMAGKVRALFERPDFKGRDFWDIWFLHHSLGVSLDPALLARKFAMYPFVQRHSRQELQEDTAGKKAPANVLDPVARDLERFVPPEIFQTLHEENFAPLLRSVHEVLQDVPAGLLD